MVLFVLFRCILAFLGGLEGMIFGVSCKVCSNGGLGVGLAIQRFIIEIRQIRPLTGIVLTQQLLGYLDVSRKMVILP